jgi:hypothetical protein
MSIELNDNIHNKTGKPDSKRYFNNAGTPYVDAAQVLSEIDIAERHPGKTVRIGEVEYEFAANLTDLVIKGYGYWKIGMRGGVKLGYMYNGTVHQDSRQITSSDNWRVAGNNRVDYYDLFTYLGGSDGLVNGDLLKEVGNNFWTGVNNGLNSVGFNLRPNGIRMNNGLFYSIGISSFLGCGGGELSWDSLFWVPDFQQLSMWASGYGNLAGVGMRLIRDVLSARELILNDGEAGDPYIGNNGIKYRTVKINDKVWIADNLAETLWRDKSPILKMTDGNDWIFNNGADLLPQVAAYCAYDNIESNAFEITEIKINSHDILEFVAGENIKIAIESGKIIISSPDGRVISDIEGLQEELNKYVVGPDRATNNTVCVYDGATGKIIKVTNVTIDEQGQMSITAIADENDYSVGLSVFANGEQAYGLVGMAHKFPITGCTLNTSGTGKKDVITLRGDSAHTEVENEYGLNIGFLMPHLGWTDPRVSEIPGGYISALLTDVLQGAERVRFEFWSLRNGVMTKQAALSDKGQMQVDSLRLTPLAAAPINPTGGEMYHGQNGHLYKFNALTLVWDDLNSDDAVELTSADGSVRINGYDLSVPRPELELFANNETELLAAWNTAIAANKAARIFITNNIVFTANRQFIQDYGSPGIKMEAITQRNFIADAYVIDFNKIDFTNITFRTTGAFYFRVVGGLGTFTNCGWIDDSTDTGERKKNILVTGPISMGTSKLVIKTPIHFTQSPGNNMTELIQPFWIENEAFFDSDSSRFYVEIREMSAVYEYSRFARVLLTSTVADCPFSVTGDESWFYAPEQENAGTGNIKATAQIVKPTETVRGHYKYDSQIFGKDTVGDWRTYSDQNGFYTQYCTVAGETKGSGTWATKQTIAI